MRRDVRLDLIPKKEANGPASEAIEFVIPTARGSDTFWLMGRVASEDAAGDGSARDATSNEIRRELSLALFAANLVSHTGAAHLAGIALEDFLQVAGRRGFPGPAPETASSGNASLPSDYSRARHDHTFVNVPAAASAYAARMRARRNACKGNY